MNVPRLSSFFTALPLPYIIVIANQRTETEVGLGMMLSSIHNSAVVFTIVQYFILWNHHHGNCLLILTQVHPPRTDAGVSGAGGHVALLFPPPPPPQTLIQAHTQGLLWKVPSQLASLYHIQSDIPFMVPYSGKFLHGANVHVFRGMLVNVKIQTTKISTKEL